MNAGWSFSESYLSLTLEIKGRQKSSYSIKADLLVVILT